MANLKDFGVGTDNLSLSDFNTTPDKVVVNSELSNVNAAAHITTLSNSDNPEGVFRDTLSSLNAGVDTLTQDGPLQPLLTSQQDTNKQAVLSILADPKVSDKQKFDITQGIDNTVKKLSTPTNLVSSVSASMQPPTDTVEVDMVNANIGAAIQRVNDYKATLQNIVNSSNAQDNPSVMESVGNFLELLLPLNEGTASASVAKDMKAGNSSYLFNTALMGEARNDIVKSLKVLPFDKRLEAVQLIVDSINKHDSAILTGDNHLLRTSFLQDVLETGDVFNNWGRIGQDIVSLLDATVLGGAVSKLFKGSKATSLISNTLKAKVRSDVKPSSLSRNVKDTSPEAVRKLDDSITNDVTGEAALAATGTTRNEAIADVRLPELGNDAGTVDNKVSMLPNDKFDFADTVKTFVNSEGAIFYSPSEKLGMREVALENISRNEMFTIKATEDLPDGLAIRGVYGMRDSGYLDPQEALLATEYAMRDLGVTKNEMTLLKLNDEGQRIPVASNITENGDYLVGVDYRYKFNPLDNRNYFKATTVRNFFDRVAGNQFGKTTGSLARFILDPASMLDPLLTKGANVAVDRTFGLEKILTDQGKVFSSGFKNLSTERRGAIEQEIKRVNKDGVDHNYNQLMGNGFSEHEVGLLKDWREIWDGVYWLENRDLGKNLRNQGFMNLIDKANDTNIFAKPIKNRGGVKDGVRVWDYANNEIRSVGKTELDWLYETGGKIAKMRSNKVIGDESVQFVVSSEQKGGSFLRAITDNDQVLNYRKGYYQVQYKSPKFVEKVVSKLKKDGTKGEELYRGAVATAASTKDGTITASRLAKSVSADEVNHVEFIVRPDIKGNALDDSYNLAFSRGRTAQRMRGERLSDGSGSGVQAMDDNHILDPVEALTKSIRSISRRTQMREYIDATTNRFLKQYKDVLPVKEGQTIYPMQRKDIGLAQNKTSKLSADARTTWEYIEYLKNGYTNSIADGHKALLNLVADLAGEYSITTKIGNKLAEPVEKGLRALGRGRSLDDLARISAFKLYLALNPARQFIVQSHQAIRLNYMNPKYMTGKAPREFPLLVAGLYDLKVPDAVVKAAGHTSKSFSKLVSDFKRSGLSSATDANNLVRSDLNKLADLTAWENVKGAANTPIKAAQKIGFDAGENTNLMLTWLAFRDRALKAGKTLDAAVLDDISAEARNWSYNMNAAGDMPYNRNIFSMIMQFAQIPHKALMANTTNRIISPATRRVSLTSDILLFGVGTGSVGLIASSLIPDKETELKSIVMRGLEENVINHSLTTMYGDNVELDMSTLAPTDMAGFGQLFFEMWTQSPGTTIANSPSGQLYFGGNARVTNLIKDSMNFFGFGPKVNVENEVEFGDVMRSALKITSGGSNALKAYQALQSGKRTNSRGQVIDSNVNTVEAWAKAFGLGTITAAQNFAISRKVYEKSKAFEADGKMILDGQLRRLSDRGMTSKEIIAANKGYGFAWQAWGVETPRGRQVLRKLLKQTLIDPASSLYRSLRTVVLDGSIPINEVKQMVFASGLPEKNKQTLLKILKDSEDPNNYRNK